MTIINHFTNVREQVENSNNYQEDNDYMQVNAVSVINNLLENADKWYNSLKELEARFRFDNENEDDNHYFHDLVEEGFLAEVLTDNTYNYNGNIMNDLIFRIYQDTETYHFFLVVNVHLQGDIRGNYSDTLVFEYEYIHDASEILQYIAEMDDVFPVTVNGAEWVLTISALSEEVSAWNPITGEETQLYGAFTEEEAVEELQALLTTNE